MKREVELEDYLEYVKEVHTRLFLKFRSDTHDLSEELGRHAKKSGSQEFPNCGAFKVSVEHGFI